ncbi:MAG TPA: SpoVR family protein [Methylocystis sp.]|nr:SpoVR family protein [Methylocystis sp.]
MSDAALFSGREWDFDTIQRIHDAIAVVAQKELGLDTYPNQIEIITAEQMLDAYASIGMPLYYKHWSFGKSFAEHEMIYRKGLQNLAYEIVINSNPCISYLLEESSATMQTLVIGHAAFGHNHFFKNNYQFKQWTDPDSILDYLAFAKGYIASCEERHGHGPVERLLDAAHALTAQGVDRYARKKSFDMKREEARERERMAEREQLYNDLWRTVPEKSGRAKRSAEEKRRALLGLPQENILYFLEKVAPRLKPWQRELLRIVRLMAQYFYPQQQTKVMNEGCATYCHYCIMTALHEQGRIDDGSLMEFLHSHTDVTRQAAYNDKYYGGINPYALGFDMMSDIARIVCEPTEEDRAWFPEIAGTGDALATLRHVWANFRDDSFIAQFLSPHLMRKWRLFHVVDDDSAKFLEVKAIHNERGYRDLRRTLASQFDVAQNAPDIQVVDVNLEGDRRLVLHHRVMNGRVLEPENAQLVLNHLAYLWGYEVTLNEIDAASEKLLKEHSAKAPA